MIVKCLVFCVKQEDHFGCTNKLPGYQANSRPVSMEAEAMHLFLKIDPVC
jgi:hypothetical protein